MQKTSHPPRRARMTPSPVDTRFLTQQLKGICLTVREHVLFPYIECVVA